jgi:hypothetical protein
MPEYVQVVFHCQEELIEVSWENWEVVVRPLPFMLKVIVWSFVSDDNHKVQCAQNCVNVRFCFGLAKTDQLLTFRLFKVLIVENKFAVQTSSI